MKDVSENETGVLVDETGVLLKKQLFWRMNRCFVNETGVLRIKVGLVFSISCHQDFATLCEVPPEQLLKLN